MKGVSVRVMITSCDSNEWEREGLRDRVQWWGVWSKCEPHTIGCDCGLMLMVSYVWGGTCKWN